MVNLQDVTSKALSIARRYVADSKDVTVPEIREYTYVIAFPGMGKTPLASKRSGFIDLDFGFFRTAMKVAKADERVLYKPFARFMIQYGESHDWTILSNEPGLLQYLPAKETVMLLPTEYRYSAKKMGVDISTIANWVEGWRDTAKRFGVKVIDVPRGLDQLKF